jgi:cellulose 1,4-beta-cellobiosidase
MLSPGQAATLTATFSPSTAGNVTGSVVVASNATNSPDTIALAGTGVAAVNHSVALTWTASTSTVIGYNTYSGTTSGGPYAKLTSAPEASTAYTDSTVQAGQTYYYVVTAVNSANEESAYSTQVSATIP